GLEGAFSAVKAAAIRGMEPVETWQSPGADAPKGLVQELVDIPIPLDHVSIGVVVTLSIRHRQFLLLKQQRSQRWPRGGAPCVRGCKRTCPPAALVRRSQRSARRCGSGHSHDAQHRSLLWKVSSKL